MLFIYALIAVVILILTAIIIKCKETKTKDDLPEVYIEENPVKSMQELRKEFLSRYIYLSNIEKINQISSVISEYSNNLEKMDYFLLKDIHEHPILYSNSLIKSLKLTVPIKGSSDYSFVNTRECYEEFLTKTSVILTREEAELVVKYNNITKKSLYTYFLYEEYLE